MPAKLKIQDLSTVLTGYGNTGLLTQKVLAFYHFIRSRQITNSIKVKKDDLIERDIEWVQITRAERRMILGEDYFKVLDILETSNLIEIDKTEYVDEETGEVFTFEYRKPEPGVPGECKRYKIPETLHKGQYKKVKVSKASVIKKLGDVRLKGSKAASEVQKRLVGLSHKLKIRDTPESRQIIEEYFYTLKQKNEKAHTYSFEDFLELYNDDLFDCHVDQFGRRLFNKICYMVRLFRPFLYFEDASDEKVEFVDIVNSQPFFLSMANAYIIKRFAPECASAIPIFEKYEKCEDVQEFKKLVRKGKIYEFIRDYFHDNFNKIITRDDAKNACYVAFFGNYNYYESIQKEFDFEYVFSSYQYFPYVEDHKDFNHLSYLFLKGKFPNLWNLYNEIKKLEWDFNPSTKGLHTNNCLLAQRIESGFIFGVVVKNILDADIENIQTCHDCLLTNLSNVAEILKIFKRCFVEELKTEPPKFKGDYTELDDEGNEEIV